MPLFAGKGYEEMRTRKRAVQVYLNEKEYEKLEQLSRFSNINHSTVIRKLITGQEIRERPNMDFLSLVTEISHLGTFRNGSIGKSQISSNGNHCNYYCDYCKRMFKARSAPHGGPGHDGW